MKTKKENDAPVVKLNKSPKAELDDLGKSMLEEMHKLDPLVNKKYDV